MIQAIYKIGEVIAGDSSFAEYFSIGDIPYNLENAKKEPIVLVVNVVDGHITSIDQELYSPANLSKYLYREAPAQSLNIVPTYKLTATGATKVKKGDTEYKINNNIEQIRKVLDKIQRTFIYNLNLLKYFGLEKEPVYVVHGFIEPDPEKSPEVDDEKLKNFIEEIRYRIENIIGEEKGDYLVTFTVNSQYLGEINEIFKYFKENFFSNYFTNNNGTARLEKGVCSLSYDEEEQIYGYIDELGFTVNDPAFVRGGFDPSAGAKMFPVSFNSLRKLRAGNLLVKKHLEYLFKKGIKYYVVPHFILQVEREIQKEVIINLINTNKKDTSTLGNISIINNETIFANIAEDESLGQPWMFYEILFFRRKKQQFEILAFLQEVMPSRIKKAYTCKKLLEAKYKRSIMGNYHPDNIITFGYLFDLFNIVPSKSKTESLHPIFWRILYAVFNEEKIDESELKAIILKKLEILHKENLQPDSEFYVLQQAVGRSFVLIEFLRHLNTFYENNLNSNLNFMQTMGNENAVIYSNAWDFVNDHPEHFNKGMKRAAFYCGCLVRTLARAQSNDAILKKLGHLRLNKDSLKILFVEVVTKLRQYDKENPEVRKLEELFGLNFNDAEPISDIDISFYYTEGLVLQNSFSYNRYETSKNNSEM